MRKFLLIFALIIGVGVLFSSCKKEEEENLAAEIAGTYEGINYSKTETGALVILSEIDETHVSMRYDIGIITKDLIPDPYKLTITKDGDVYKLSGSTAIEKIEGTVQGDVLKLKVYMSEMEAVNIVAEKQKKNKGNL